MPLESEKLAARLLDLSYRVSNAAPAMKPFMRFSPNSISDAAARRYWDFDTLLQKRLLEFLYQLVPARDFARLGIEQWSSNLDQLLSIRTRQLEAAQQQHGPLPDFDYVTSKMKILTDHLSPGDRLLYIGAGTGTECLIFAGYGLRVVGIDILAPLVDVARKWANHLERDAAFACMDMDALGFAPHSFDGFFLELYGNQTDPALVIALQRGLARLLAPGGWGFISAPRKKYASYWFRMGTNCPAAMVRWLMPQADLDYYFEPVDANEPALAYGLYLHPYSRESLAAELNPIFEIAQTGYLDNDPRYVWTLVHPRPNVTIDPRVVPAVDPLPLTAAQFAKISTTADLIAQVCDQLEDHTRQVFALFKQGADSGPVNPFKSISPDLEYLAVSLNKIFS